jgi:hypothetical protein
MSDASDVADRAIASLPREPDCALLDDLIVLPECERAAVQALVARSRRSGAPKSTMLHEDCVERR